MKDIFGNLVAFVAHYADEAEAAALALNAIVDHLPIQAQDKAQIKGYIEKVADAPGAIREWIDNAPTPTPIKIDAADVNKAVAKAIGNSDAFNDAVNKAVAANLSAAIEGRLPELASEVSRIIGNGPVADPARDLRDTDNAADLAEKDAADGNTTRQRQTAADGGKASDTPKPEKSGK